MVVSQLLTSEQAAVYLGVRQKMLRTMPLPVVMLDRDPRYSVRDLDRYIMSRRLLPVREAAR